MEEHCEHADQVLNDLPCPGTLLVSINLLLRNGAMYVH